MKTLIIAALLCVPGLLAVASFPVVDSSASECWAMATFQPDGSAFVKQNSTSTQGGRTCAAEPALSLSKGPYDGRTGVRKTKFHVESRGTDFWHDGVTCGSGTGFVTKKGKSLPKTQSTDSLPTGCQLLFNEAYTYDNNQDWQLAYNAGMQLVEQCADSSLAFGSVSDAFSLMQQAADGIGNYGTFRSGFYNWLKSVLYLNTTDPEYFCQCVYTMAGEVPIPNSIYPDTGYNWNLALINWLIQNTSCDSSYLRGLYKNSRTIQYQDWSNASGEYKLDTTLPPLDSIDPGLQELLDKHFLYAAVPENYVEIISNATANPNPVTSGTVISFGISQEAYVKIEVFDILGHEVASAGFESLFEPGNKSVPISLAGLPSGTYFARILTAYGEVQSVKLVKE